MAGKSVRSSCTRCASSKCTSAAVSLGCVGLGPVRAHEAESVMVGSQMDEKAIARAADAARSAGDPQSDMRGTADYKRALVAGLLKQAARVALRRALGQHVEVSHLYA